MNEREARAQGLNFTGMYNSNKEITKREIEAARKKYPRARIVLVREPVDKLSRSYTPGACGWSAYADNKYSAYQTLERLGNIEERHTKRLDTINNDYQQKLAAEETQYAKELESAKNALAILS